MDNNQRQQEAIDQNSNVAFGSSLKHKILKFLEENPEKEYNASTISKHLGIPLNKTTATLSRECKAGRIWRPQRGFYAYNFTLNKHQIQKIEERIRFGIHNITIIIPKKPPSKNLPLLFPTVGGDVAFLDSSKTNKSQPDATSEFEGAQKIFSDTNELNQKITILEYVDKFMIIMSADQSPLSAREFLWLYTMLKSMFGDATQSAIISKFEPNVDIPISWSPNQLTLGDAKGICLALYGKGDNTRIELRNFHPVNVLFKEFIARLFSFADEITTSKPEADKPKATDSNQKQHEINLEFERLPIPIKTGGEASTPRGYA